MGKTLREDGRMGEDGGFGLKSFQARGLNALEGTEFDGAQLLDILCGPFNIRKQRVLEALLLFHNLAARQTEYGPPLAGRIIEVPINADEVNADARTPTVFDAEVVVPSEVFDEIGQRPVAVQLDRLRVTLELAWHGAVAHYTVTRFETGNGRDFAKGDRHFNEIRDLALAIVLCALAVDTLLASARASHSNVDFQPEGSLPNEREQNVLDIVGSFQFTHGERAPASEVVLSFPPEDAEAANAAVETLVNKGYLDRVADTLSLTPAGLLLCDRAGEAAEFARRFMDYLRYRAGQLRARFTRFTWNELKTANLAGRDDEAFVRALIAILRIAGGGSPWSDGRRRSWTCPNDMATLRAISDIHGLRSRAERIYKEEAAAAEAARQADIANQELVKHARAMSHTRAEGVNPMAEDKAIAMRRELLKKFYDAYMESPTRQIGWGPDESDPNSIIRIREAKWLHEHGLIAAKFGAVGDFMATLTVKGRDFVEAGGFDRSNNSTESNQRLTEVLSMQKPRIFIGSSVEGLTIAKYVQLGLDHQAECTLWSQGVFGLSGGTLDSLLRAVKDYEFAVLILTPDDLVHKRDTTKNSPRDNVLFELGLFMGALGRERTYIVYCRDEKPDLPTDLAGVTAATYAKRSDGNLHAALGSVCTQIEIAINAVKGKK